MVAVQNRAAIWSCSAQGWAHAEQASDVSPPGTVVFGCV